MRKIALMAMAVVLLGAVASFAYDAQVQSATNFPAHPSRYHFWKAVGGDGDEQSLLYKITENDLKTIVSNLNEMRVSITTTSLTVMGSATLGITNITAVNNLSVEGILTNKGAVVNESTVTTTGVGVNNGVVSNNSVVVNSGIVSNKSLTVLNGALRVAGTVTNSAALTQAGTAMFSSAVTNKAALVNETTVTTTGVMINNGVVSNNSVVVNSGIVSNTSTVVNNSVVINSGVVSNNSVVVNSGIVSNKSLTILDGNIRVAGYQTNVSGVVMSSTLSVDGRVTMNATNAIAFASGATIVGDQVSTNSIYIPAGANGTNWVWVYGQVNSSNAYLPVIWAQ